MMSNKIKFILLLVLIIPFVNAEEDHNCRLLASMSDNFPANLINSQLLNDSASMKALGASNPDGWGIVYYNTIGSNATITRGKLPASTDTSFINLSYNLSSSEPKIILTHVRICTSGCCTHDSTIPDPHPFTMYKNGKSYSFIHNGAVSISNVQTLINSTYIYNNPYTGSNLAECNYCDNSSLLVDSEVLFRYIMQQIELYDWNVTKGISDATNTLINSGYANSGINFILSDGEKLWGFKYATHTLYYLNSTDYLSIASQPTNTSQPWIAMTNKQLVEMSIGAQPVVSNIQDNLYLNDLTNISTEIVSNNTLVYTDGYVTFNSTNRTGIMINDSYLNTYTTANFTFNAWVYPVNTSSSTSLSSSPRIMSIENGNTARGWTIYMLNPEGINATHYSSTPCLTNVSSETCMPSANSPKLEKYKWNMLTVVRNLTNVDIYVDGVKQTGTIYNITYTGLLNNTGGLITIGNSRNWNRGFNGSMDDLQIYNYTLSDAEILNLYNIGRNNASNIPMTNSIFYMSFDKVQITNNYNYSTEIRNNYLSQKYVYCVKNCYYEVGVCAGNCSGATKSVSQWTTMKSEIVVCNQLGCS